MLVLRLTILGTLLMFASCRGNDEGNGGSPQCTTGVPCVNDDDCQGGERCNRNLGPPECQVLYCGTNGTICDGDELCGEDYKCNEMAEPPVCVDGSAGDPCYPISEYECQSGLWCNWVEDDPGTCDTPGRLGDICSPRLNSCSEGLWCNDIDVEADEKPRCTQLHGLGGSCNPSSNTQHAGCEDGFWCNNIDADPPQCAPLGQSGDSCYNSDDCDSQHYCNQADECAARAREGEVCSGNAYAPCLNELYCDRDTGLCAPRLRNGEVCTSSTPPCLMESHCSRTTSTCLSSGEAGEQCDPMDYYSCLENLYCDPETERCIGEDW